MQFYGQNDFMDICSFLNLEVQDIIPLPDIGDQPRDTRMKAAMQQMFLPQQYVGQWWGPTAIPVSSMAAAPMMPAGCFMWPAPESTAEPPRQSRQQRRRQARQGCCASLYKREVATMSPQN